ncbi:hypothetical protein AVEN_179485-1 [Araneus ventricosus]|uniref:Uncharacterized protein n=1 Tax=Araneus ventricosus TaxID=182803 RepID=A0A4Y2BG94_ARAVE|nr:hypothetical protein AVEN_179485-1 [Araneus ventricosus]
MHRTSGLMLGVCVHQACIHGGSSVESGFGHGALRPRSSDLLLGNRVLLLVAKRSFEVAFWTALKHFLHSKTCLENTPPPHLQYQLSTTLEHFNGRLEEELPINAQRLLDASADWFKLMKLKAS